MIIGIGCDIVEVKRVGKAMEREGFAEKCFLEGEVSSNIRSMAGFFAAKEAVSKALGTGFSGFSPKDIEVKNEASGKPVVRLHGGAKKLAGNLGVKKISLSISHSDNNAIAFAVLEGE